MLFILLIFAALASAVTSGWIGIDNPKISFNCLVCAIGFATWAIIIHFDGLPHG